MAEKRALIVDDSRSARAILSRMLETYGMQVDTAESAEQAVEHLRHHRPYVIFMDHLMPGMDGFQAIQAIKSNPDTATIPVMMYTSQEGEMYVSQARALGAVGVLPKTVKQADVSRALYQLNLLPDRRGHASVLFRESSGSGEVSADESGPPPRVEVDVDHTLRPMISQLMKEQHSELRRYVHATFESFARRVGTEIKESSPGVAPTVPEALSETPPPPEVLPPAPFISDRLWGFSLVALAILPALILAVLYLRTLQSVDRLSLATARLSSVITEQQQRIGALEMSLHRSGVVAPVQAAEAGAVLQPEAAAIPMEIVPYGEIPLSGTRLERLRGLAERLRGEGFRGVIKVVSFVGDFCLTGSAADGYSIAPDDQPAKRCDLIGNPVDDGLRPAQRQSLGFANLVSTIRRETAGALRVEVVFAGRKPAVPYPALSDKLSAGEWNRIATRNHRVEFAAAPG